jgi:structural maintenance of chromosome 2
MKEMEKEMRAAQMRSSSLKSDYSSVKARHDTLTAELKALTQENQSMSEQLTIVYRGIGKLEEEIGRLQQEVNTCRTAYETVKMALAAKQTEMNHASKEAKTLETNREKSLKAAQTASLEARKISHKLKQWESESKETGKKIAVMLRQYPWIDKEKRFFGVAGSDFDFATADVTQNQRRLTQLKNDQEKLMRKVNKKVMGMIEKAETEYKDLNQKREVILKDKSKIEAVIEELDVKKTQALETTWTKVNRDFGSIFSMLLPGTTAKLDPPENQSASEGLEVKVAFNGVWKDSLTELSGGQRSLLALSLILSLLLFKPAPMYILDEVDAALDLSHTQNIGLMLRTHFSSSQFIVVSLKEGMFNNANVIFRTRFVDGVSAVTRTVAGGKNRPLQNAISLAKENQLDGEAEFPASKKKKGGKSTDQNRHPRSTEIDI